MVNGTTPRRINDSYDNVDTLIRNSKGNYWAATGANIQLAIDDLSSGGTVWLPIGNFSTSGIVVGNNTRLVGSGRGLTILFLDDSMDANVVECINSNNITIESLTVDGNYANQVDGGTSASQCGIMFRSTDDSTVRDVNIKNLFYYGVHCYVNSNSNLIDNCNITDSYVGVSTYSDSYYNVISNNHIYGCNFNVHGHMRVDGTTIVDNDLHNADDSNIYFYNTDNVIITGNNVYSSSHDGIKLGTVANYASYCTISNNLFYNNIDISSVYLYYANYCTVSNNIFDAAHTNDRAITVWTTSEGNTITGNVIKNHGTAFKIHGDNNIIKNNVVDGSTNVYYNVGSGNIFEDNIGYDYDSLQDDYIWNSEGTYYPTTETGLQVAIDDLTNGGWVEIPGDTTITLATPPLTIGDDVWLRGAGNSSVIKLGDSEDEIMITNSDTTNGNTCIRISDICFDGNNDNQPNGYAQQARQLRANGIQLVRCDNSTVENVYVKDTSAIGIYILDGMDNRVLYNWVYGAGSHEIGTGVEDWIPCGIIGDSTKNLQIIGNSIKTCYGNGITTEYRLGYNPGTSFCNIDNNIVSDCFYGIYVEHVDNHTITNNIIHDNNREESYKGDSAGGIRLGSPNHPVNHSIVAFNVLSRNGNLSKVDGTNIWVDGEGVSIIGNILTDSSDIGIYIGSGNHNVISGNTIHSAGDNGIESCSLNTVISDNNVMYTVGKGIYQYYALGDDPADNLASAISGNVITGTTEYGIFAYQSHTAITGNALDDIGSDGMKLVSMNNCTVTGNTINDDSDANDGIEVADCFDMVFTGNVITGFDDGIDETGICDYNIYVGNNARWCTNGFDFNGANNNVTANMGTHI